MKQMHLKMTDGMVHVKHVSHNDGTFVVWPKIVVIQSLGFFLLTDDHNAHHAMYEEVRGALFFEL